MQGQTNPCFEKVSEIPAYFVPGCAGSIQLAQPRPQCLGLWQRDADPTIQKPATPWSTSNSYYPWQSSPNTWAQCWIPQESASLRIVNQLELLPPLRVCDPKMLVHVSMYIGDGWHGPYVQKSIMWISPWSFGYSKIAQTTSWLQVTLLECISKNVLYLSWQHRHDVNIKWAREKM